jgi:hypothetical protein
MAGHGEFAATLRALTETPLDSRFSPSLPAYSVSGNQQAVWGANGA